MQHHAISQYRIKFDNHNSVFILFALLILYQAYGDESGVQVNSDTTYTPHKELNKTTENLNCQSSSRSRQGESRNCHTGSTTRTVIHSTKPRH
jgi:hypothetical protein